MRHLRCAVEVHRRGRGARLRCVVGYANENSEIPRLAVISEFCESHSSNPQLTVEVRSRGAQSRCVVGYSNKNSEIPRLAVISEFREFHSSNPQPTVEVRSRGAQSRCVVGYSNENSEIHSSNAQPTTTKGESTVVGCGLLERKQRNSEISGHLGILRISFT